MPDNNILIIFIVALTIAIPLFLFIFSRNIKSSLDKEKYRCSWLKIENSLDKNNIDTYHFAVLSADKLLDQALKESDVPGDKMGDRLKNSKKKFSNTNQVWAAHKIRNQIAHEADTKIDFLGARRALATYKKALKELGAI